MVIFSFFIVRRSGNPGYIALNDLNISIKKNEIFGFLGPSGAGKSTLINVITGQLGYEKGNSHIFDKNWMLIS